MCELKQLALILKESFVFENDRVRPEKACGTQRINHKIKAMKNLNDKFGAFDAHLENVISDSSKKCDRATLQGKYNNVTQARVLLRSALYLKRLRYLQPTRELSLATQFEDIDIVLICC